MEELFITENIKTIKTLKGKNKKKLERKVMKISTIQFGEIDFDEKSIIHFKSGLFGFEELKKFLLLKTEDELFFWLNSIEQPEIAFPIIGLRLIDENFPSSENEEAFGIVTLNKDPLEITVNLKAPVFINQDTRSGYQKIIEEDTYPVDYYLFTK